MDFKIVIPPKAGRSDLINCGWQTSPSANEKLAHREVRQPPLIKLEIRNDDLYFADDFARGIRIIT
jgi:hypothetical protein